MTKEDIILLIPAVNPEQNLLYLLKNITEHWAGPIVLVNDGSDKKCDEIFLQAEEMGCIVLRHACNLGKGRALKTGFNECLNRWENMAGVVTADADGQHLIQDILACRDAFYEQPDALILGCRDFSGEEVPWRSSFGNRMTCAVMRFLCGVNTSDTQTGLRAIPAEFMRYLLGIGGERFEFETNMLLETRTQEISITDIPIQTVYLEQNRASHFHPLRDSIRIYTLLLKFCMASFLGFIIDIIAFSIISALFAPFALGAITITIATVIARVMSASVNYLLNHRVVFESKQKASKSAMRYTALSIVQMLASAGLVTALAAVLPMVSAVILKVIVDFLLFFISFQIQQKWVF